MVEKAERLSTRHWHTLRDVSILIALLLACGLIGLAWLGRQAWRALHDTD